MVSPELQQQAIQAAVAVRRRAYAPYSRFQVGAALVSGGSEIYSGCNVENASYGLTICAERAAVLSAVAAGHHSFDLLVVATAGGYAPCGACRQVLAEFSAELPVLLINTEDSSSVAWHNLATLLPHTFSLATRSKASPG